jgi:hypothetical protein
VIGGLRLVPEEPDQVLRKQEFQAGHPAVRMKQEEVLGASYWAATFPEGRSMRTVIGRTLKGLLDKLEALSDPGG